MSDMKELIEKFKADVYLYPGLKNRTNFHLSDEFDELDDEYLVFYHDAELMFDQGFRNFSAGLQVKHFISKNIYNVGFIYKFPTN